MKKKICGIYIIKNNINNKVYIGQSVDINARWSAHKYSALRPQHQTYNVEIHKAMREFGVNEFYIETLEECNYLQLSEKEIYWIKKFNSYKKGYNMTLGGESNRGEANGRAILTEVQVEDIRMSYNARIPFRTVLEKYKGIISKRGLQKVWHFETWKYIMPEVYTEENRLWHKTYAKGHTNGNLELGKNNKTRACSEEEIEEIRRLRKLGYTYEQIAKKVSRSNSVVRKYCLFQECQKENKVHNSIQVINIETGLVFESLTKASKWSQTDRNTLSKNKNTNKSAGIVPTTGLPAHWKTL